jgi:hypothetical protein
MVKNGERAFGIYVTVHAVRNLASDLAEADNRIGGTNKYDPREFKGVEFEKPAAELIGTREEQKKAVWGFERRLPACHRSA